MQEMTPRQRMINMIRGEEVDELPFAAYRGMLPFGEIREVFGFNSLGVLGWTPAHRTISPNCTRREETGVDENGYECVIDYLDTPKGTLVQKRAVVPAWGGPWGWIEHFVKTAEDLEALLSYFQDSHVEMDTSGIESFNAEHGEGGLPHVSLPRTPYQQLWIEWADINDVAALMFDSPDLVEEVFQAMAEHYLQAVKTTAQAAKTCNFHHTTIGENVTAPMIGPKVFEKWCLPLYQQAAGIMNEAGIRFMVHLDGYLEPLWDLLDDSGIGGIDSLSPPPDNDTPVGMALERWPDMMIWANFPSSVHLREVTEIRRMAEQLLSEGGHTKRFWIQISEDMPPNRWRESFPEIIGAIRDFGRP